MLQSSALLNVALVRFVHPLKAFAPMLVTLVGIVILVRAVHAENALSLILVIPSEITIDVMESICDFHKPANGEKLGMLPFPDIVTIPAALSKFQVKISNVMLEILIHSAKTVSLILVTLSGI